ncbi:MAG: J domain-containing protein [Leptospira sp.]|nr:J domain-containing protein [Leptospira sp.]
MKKNKTGTDSRGASKERSLVKIDEIPIRKKYFSGFKKTRKEIEKFKKDWDEFEKEDQPAFTKWYNLFFGARITELRELEQKSEELQQLLREIEFVKYQKKTSYYKAYLLVQSRKNNPETPDKKNDSNEYYSGKYYDRTEEEFKESRADYQNDDLADLFETVIASNPLLRDLLRRNKNAYKVFFEKFKADFFSDKETHSGKYHATKEEKTKSTDELIKARYRALVRKLHPDYRKVNDERSNELWHEVQKAYSENDLDRLDMLVALCDIHTGDTEGSTSISQLISVISEYKNQLKALKKRLKQAKQDIAWGFSRKKDKEHLKKSLDREIRENTLKHRMNVERFQKLLKNWSRPPARSTS